MSRASVARALQEQREAVASAGRDTLRAMSDIGYAIRDRTSSKGFVPGMNPMFDAMRQAAANAGLSRLEVVAGKGQGHLSHAHGTEADIVGYNADGSKWSKAQRVAVARGAATAGGNRFGLYSGSTLHVGLGYKGSPHNVVWNNQLRGQPGVATFAPEERDFVNALRTGKLLSYTAPVTAPAYTATAATTPAQQAITAQTTARIPQPRPANPYINSTGGANAIKVPTSSVKASPFPGVQLPSYGSNITYPNAIQQGAHRVPTTAVPYSPSIAPVSAAPGTLNRPAIQTPYLNQPYTTSLGGANAIVQPAQTARIPQARPPGLQWSSLQQPAQPAAAQVPTARIPQARPQSPYLNSTGGSNALTARIPQARPAYPQQPATTAPTAGPTMYQQAMAAAQHAADVAAQVAQRAKDAYSQSTRSGMGYSGGSGYTGGSYGGSAGRSINSGVGGAYRNR